MKLLSSTIIAGLAVAVCAAPAEQQSKQAPVTGKSNGSIFMFGDTNKCRQTFWRYGACGLSTYFADKVDKNMPLVAMPTGTFDRYGEAQDNKLCGKVITMSHNGVTRKAVVADENTSSEQTIDMCLENWQAFGGHDNDGTLIRNINWSIAT